MLHQQQHQWTRSAARADVHAPRESHVHATLLPAQRSLQVDNRVCVALSRARVGLFICANLQMLASKSTLWERVHRRVHVLCRRR